MTGRTADRLQPAVPRHVAFVMDGNGRWATRQGLPRLAGHRAGIANVAPVADGLVRRGVEYMTIYMFSTENWKRPADEVSGILLQALWPTRTTAACPPERPGRHL